MSGIDLVKQVIASMEANDFDKAGSLINDDMTFDGPVPEPVGKNEFLGLMKGLVSAIPDWNFHAADYQENGNVVSCTFEISGNHTRALSLPMIPQPVPASGKHVQLPKEHLEFTLAGNKVSRLHSDNVPGAGVGGVMAQIGVVMPH